MKYDMHTTVMTYDGKPFTRPVVVDNQPVLDEHGRPKQEPLTLQMILETACLNADPAEYNTGERKMVVFNLLMKIHAADPIADLSAEEVSTLKALVGKQLTVGAVGSVYKALEKPLAD